MKTGLSSAGRARRAAVAVAAVMTAGLAATAAAFATTQEAPTFKEFSDTVFRDTDGQYVLNGDEPALNRGDLRGYYDKMTKEPKGQTHEDGLIINKVNGVMDKWSATQALNLTYCVSTKFNADYSRVVSAMNAGVGLWESASPGINYIHVSSQDSSCNTRNNSVVFSVEPTKTQQYIARAFFPSYPKSSRNVLVNARSLYNAGSWTPGNIMGHELGHTLGFRHEHTRPESGTCFEDNNWIPLTPYDSASIMHYPQCNGTSADLSMTEQDRAGVRAVYGS